jgi:hypothetical protein
MYKFAATSWFCFQPNLNSKPTWLNRQFMRAGWFALSLFCKHCCRRVCWSLSRCCFEPLPESKTFVLRRLPVAAAGLRRSRFAGGWWLLSFGRRFPRRHARCIVCHLHASRESARCRPLAASCGQLMRRMHASICILSSPVSFVEAVLISLLTCTSISALGPCIHFSLCCTIHALALSRLLAWLLRRDSTYAQPPPLHLPQRPPTTEP